MNGIINFLKPAGMTSHDAVSFFRKLTGIKRIGHTGTLDPMATGVLPICIGRATRLIEYLEADKGYRALLKLGMRSETGDIWGQDVESTALEEYPSSSTIDECLITFKGDIVQKVPAYSAHKHEGKKLYDYARSGKDVPVKTKAVHINNIIVKSVSPDNNEIMFDVKCSMGTYIRTICTDVGDKLGTGAVMSFLLRTEASGLNINDSVTTEELIKEKEQSGNISKYLKKPGDLLENMDRITLNEKDAGNFINGLSIDVIINENVEYAVFLDDSVDSQKLIGIGIGHNNKLKPKKVVFSEQ